MRGQWLGSYTGGNNQRGVNSDGKIMINIDEVGDHFEGVAYLYPTEKNQFFYTIAYFSTQNKNTNQATKAIIFPIHPRTGFQCTWEDIKTLAKELGGDLEEGTYTSNADVNVSVQHNRLHINAISAIGDTVTAVLDKSSGIAKSKIEGQKMSWDEFKSNLHTIAKRGYLFRGQQEPWSLCTSFHRRGRYRISEFTNKDVKQLHQQLSAITPHFFDLTVPDQNGAFFNLLQHHGYPTPLLDWSRSPYVAAFFAFRGRPINYDGDDVVRIYVFNNQEWLRHYRQIQNIDPPFPHLSVVEFIAINNPRLVPQQSVTTVTNLHDIEAYIMERETETGVRFLGAIDIPARERDVAMRDLRFMGITAGSMFPSIDGVCEEIRERNFDQ